MIMKSGRFHLAIVIGLWAAATAGHYWTLVSVFNSPDFILLYEPTAVTLTRWLVLLPVIYASISGNTKCWLVAGIGSLLALLGSTILSPTPLPALGESLIMAILGVLFLWMVTKHQSAQSAHSRALNDLEETRQQLQRYVVSARENEQRHNIFNIIAAVLGESLELKPILEKTTRLIATLIEAEIAAVFVNSEDETIMTLVAHNGIDEGVAERLVSLPIASTGLEATLVSGKPQVMESSAPLTGMIPADMATYLLVPLVLHNNIRGVLLLGLREARPFASDDIDLLGTIGTQIATTIENTMLYEKERLAAQKLAVSERNYRQLFENASDAIWVHDLKGNITAVNRASEKIAGYTMDELLNMNVKQFLSTKSLALASRIRRRLLNKKPVKQPYVQRLRTKEGHEVVLKLATSLVTEYGHPLGFQHIARDVTKELSHQRNLYSYLQEITKAQEEERKRIARELHDETAQSLYALNRQVDNFVRANLDLPSHNTAFLNNLGIQIRDILQSLRRFSQDLRPPMLEDLGLLATLRWLSSEMKEHHKLEVQINVIGIEKRLPPDVEFTLFRIVQEALRNVEKHAQATQADVTVEFAADRIAVAVHDNGKGFRLSADSGDLVRKGKLGLAGMAERANLIDGEIKITAAPGQGTTVTVEVPLQSPYERAWQKPNHEE